MQISVRCFGFPLSWYRPIAEAVEREGFHGLWIPDHVVSPSSTDGAYPYSAHGHPSFDPSTPFADPLVMVGHLAAATSRLQLGVGVFVLPLRHPLVAARSVMSAQELSQGRLALGVGVGWMEAEFDALDAPFEGRGERVEEQLAVMRKLWTGKPVEHDGQWYRFSELTVAPGVSSAVPVLIGGATPRALRRAARHGDGWCGPPGTTDQTAQHIRGIEQALHRSGRERSSFRVVARVAEGDPVGGATALAAEAVDEAVLNLPRDAETVGNVLTWVASTAERLRQVGLLR